MINAQVLDHGPPQAAALWYVTRWGALVAPGDPIRKQPTITTGRAHAEFSSRDPAVVAAWPQWQKSGVRVAVVTGPASGVLVIDADKTDRTDGLKSLRDLERQHGELPVTPSQQTARGEQRVFRYPPGVHVKSTASEIAPGVDVRAYGGIIIAPPAPDRRWLVDAHPADVPLADLPAAWARALAAADHHRFHTRDDAPGGCIANHTRNVTLASLRDTPTSASWSI